MSLREKISHLRKVITVEPIVLIHTAVCYSFIFAEKHDRYLYQQPDWNPLGYMDIWNTFEYMDVWNTFGYKDVLRYFFPTIFLLVLGSYSDHNHIRKLFLVLPLFGELIIVLSVFVCTIQDEPDITCTSNILTILKTIASHFGGLSLTLLMAFVYVADITDDKTRTFRFAIIQLISFSDSSIRFYKAFFTIFFYDMNIKVWSLVSGSALLVAILYGIFWIPGSKGPKTFSFKTVLNFFNPKHVPRTFKTLFMKRPGRCVILVLLGVVLVKMITNYFAQLLLWTINGSYVGTLWKYSPLIVPLISLSAVIICIEILRLNDVLILLLNVILFGVSVLILLMAKNVEMIALGEMIYTSSGVILSAVCASMVTKLVSKEEYAKILASSPFFIALIIFNFRYIPYTTITTEFSCFYSVVVLFIVLVPAVMCIRYEVKKDAKIEEIVDSNHEDINYTTSPV